MTIRLLPGVILGALLAIAAVGPVAAASTITRTDLTGTSFLNPCTGERTTITGGTFQLIVNATSDGAGGFHLTMRGNAQQVEAEGATSGEMYRLAGDFWSEQYVADGGYPQTLQVVEVHNAISAGSASNFIVQIVRHLTVTATGEVTATVEDVRAECRG